MSGGNGGRPLISTATTSADFSHFYAAARIQALCLVQSRVIDVAALVAAVEGA